MGSISIENMKWICENLEYGINVFQQKHDMESWSCGINIVPKHWMIFETKKTKKLWNQETKKPKHQEAKKPRHPYTFLFSIKGIPLIISQSLFYCLPLFNARSLFRQAALTNKNQQRSSEIQQTDTASASKWAMLAHLDLLEASQRFFCKRRWSKNLNSPGHKILEFIFTRQM